MFFSIELLYISLELAVAGQLSVCTIPTSSADMYAVFGDLKNGEYDDFEEIKNIFIHTTVTVLAV